MKQVFTLLAFVLMSSGLAQVPEYVPADGLLAWYPFNSTSEDAGPGGFDMCATEISFVEGRWGDVNGAYSSTYGGQILSSCAAEGEWSDEITYSMWFNPTDLTVDPYPSDWFALLTMNGWTQSALGVLLSIQGAPCLSNQCLIRPHWPSNQSFGECADVVSNEWYHLCVTGSHDSSFTYLNGQMILSSIHEDGTDFSEVPFGWTLGASTVDHTYHFKGAFDDVGIWNRALSEDEVMTLFNAPAPASGCTDESACNYILGAQIDDGSCVSCVVATAFCGEGTTWDAESQTCIISIPSDTDFDGCVGMIDLLDLLSVFGTCVEVPWACGDPLEYQGYDYATVSIGEQCWFAENLRAVNSMNGDQIAHLQGQEDWVATDEPGWCYYEDSSGTNLPEFGKLYNFYVIGSGMCPSGWHVPNFAEWFQEGGLRAWISEEFPSIGIEAGGALKSTGTTEWLAPNEGATNEFHFNGRPSGGRNLEGEFIPLGTEANFHINNTFGGGEAHHVFLKHHTTSFDRDSPWQGDTPATLHWGASIRCIQDSE